MKNRNLEQNDLLFNVQIEFGVHGVNNWKSFIKQLNEYLAKAGDTIRVVGVQVKKPTARVDVSDALNLTDLAINTNDVNLAKYANLSNEAKFWAFISQMNNIMNNSINQSLKKKEEEENDKEPDRVD